MTDLLNPTTGKKHRPAKTGPRKGGRVDVPVVRRTLEAALSRHAVASSPCVFEAALIASFDRVEAPGLGTMAVTFVGYRPTLFYDPETVASYSDAELMLTLKHEVTHLTNHHIIRRIALTRRFAHASADRLEAMLQSRAHAIAADYAVNSPLYYSERRMGDPSRPLGYWALPHEMGLPPMLSYEQYFDRVLKALRAQYEAEQEALSAYEIALKHASSSKGKGKKSSRSKRGGDLAPEDGGDDGDAGEDGDDDDGAEDEEGGSDSDTGEEEAPPSPPPMPAHAKFCFDTKPEDCQELARPLSLSDVIKAEIKLAELAAKAEAEQEKSGGADAPVRPMPTLTELEAALEMAVASAEQTASAAGQSLDGIYGRSRITESFDIPEGVDGLYDALSAVSCSHIGEGYEESMAHINRGAAARATSVARQGADGVALARRIPLFPGYGEATTLSVAIVLDTSGSMTDAMLSYGISVTRDVLEELNIQEGVLLECDDRAVRALHLVPGASMPQDVVGRGGTEFDPGLRGAVEWAENNGVTLDAIVYITDGYASRPQYDPKIPIIWALVGQSVPVRLGEPGNVNVKLKEYF